MLVVSLFITLGSLSTLTILAEYKLNIKVRPNKMFNFKA